MINQTQPQHPIRVWAISPCRRHSMRPGRRPHERAATQYEPDLWAFPYTTVNTPAEATAIIGQMIGNDGITDGFWEEAAGES